jgi:hypothetical protein
MAHRRTVIHSLCDDNRSLCPLVAELAAADCQRQGSIEGNLAGNKLRPRPAKNRPLHAGGDLVVFWERAPTG